MPGSSVKIIFNDIPKIRKELRPKAGLIVRATALGIERDAKSRAPVDTGTLRRSIHSEKQGVFSWVVGTDVFYAPYQEYGTRGRPAHPFLIPAAEAARAPFIAAMKKLL